jgi:uncharacterized protein YbjT (DUF2867 family)
MEVVLVGSTGLVGNEVLKQLISENSVSKINVLTRKKIHFQSPKVINHVVDFENENDLKKAIQGEIVICCIGTTKAKTPNVTEYEKIDRDIPVRLAKIGKENGISQYHLISAIGANKNSSINYNRIKGEAEEGVLAAGILKTLIYRPGMLIGKRNESRPGEFIAQKLSFLFDLFMIGSMKKYHSVKANYLANKLVKNCIENVGRGYGIKFFPFDLE